MDQSATHGSFHVDRVPWRTEKWGEIERDCVIMEIRCLEKFLLKRSDIGENKDGASWDAWIKSIPGREMARCKFPEAGQAWLIPEAEIEPAWSKVGLGHRWDGRSRGQPGPGLVGPCYSVRVQSPCGSTFMESHGRLLRRGAMWPNLYCKASI